MRKVIDQNKLKRRRERLILENENLQKEIDAAVREHSEDLTEIILNKQFKQAAIQRRLTIIDELTGLLED